MNNDEQRQQAHQDALDTTALLTVPEAYLRLRISKWKIYDLMNRRLLGYVFIGSRRFVPVIALRRYLQQLMQESFA